MNHPFAIDIQGKAVNEQWHDDAQMFVAASEAALLHPTNMPWLKHYNCARLLEYAANCYRHAAGTTIGHKKSDRYHEQEKACRDLMDYHYPQAKLHYEQMVKAPNMIANMETMAAVTGSPTGQK